MTNSCLTRNNVTLSGNTDSSHSLFFVHGLGSDQQAWGPVAKAFAQDFRLIGYDQTGATAANRTFFKSRQSHYLSLDGYVDDLLEVCEALKLARPAIFVGHSLGAMVCLLASKKRPEWFEKLVLIGASPCYQNIGDYPGGMDRSQIHAIYDLMHADYFQWTSDFAAAAMEDALHAQSFQQALSGIPAEMMLTVLCSALQTDHRADLDSVTTPTLILQTRHDLFVPGAVADYLHAKIAGSRLTLIEADGHFPHISAPEPVIDAISAFIR